MTETLMLQNVAYVHAVFVSFIHFEKYELRTRKKFSTFFSSLFRPEKPSMKMKKN